MEVGVARVEQPAVAAADRDAGVAERMARERHQEDLRRQALEVTHGGEAVPALATAVFVGAPVGLRRPLLRPVAHAIEDRALRRRVGALGLEQVDPGVREIVQAACAVEVKVRKDDVPDVARIVAQPLELPDRRHFLAQLGAEEKEEEAAQPAPRIGDVAQAEPGVDEHEVRGSLDEQAMAGEAPAQRKSAAPVHERPAERARGDAVQVMDALAHGFLEAEFLESGILESDPRSLRRTPEVAAVALVAGPDLVDDHLAAEGQAALAAKDGARARADRHAYARANAHADVAAAAEDPEAEADAAAAAMERRRLGEPDALHGAIVERRAARRLSPG